MNWQYCWQFLVHRLHWVEIFEVTDGTQWWKGLYRPTFSGQSFYNNTMRDIKCIVQNSIKRLWDQRALAAIERLMRTAISAAEQLSSYCCSNNSNDADGRNSPAVPNNTGCADYDGRLPRKRVERVDLHMSHNNGNILPENSCVSEVAVSRRSGCCAESRRRH